MGPDKTPRKPRGTGIRTWLPTLVIVVVLGAGLLVLVTVVPVPHQVPETFLIGESNGFGCIGSPNITSPYDGSLKFSWTTNDSRPVTVYLDRGPTGPGPGETLTVYSGTGTNGSGDVQILTDYVYAFEMCNPPTTVQITGTLYYDAPLL